MGQLQSVTAPKIGWNAAGHAGQGRRCCTKLTLFVQSLPGRTAMVPQSTPQFLLQVFKPLHVQIAGTLHLSATGK